MPPWIRPCKSRLDDWSASVAILRWQVTNRLTIYILGTEIYHIIYYICIDQYITMLGFWYIDQYIYIYISGPCSGSVHAGHIKKPFGWHVVVPPRAQNREDRLENCVSLDLQSLEARVDKIMRTGCLEQIIRSHGSEWIWNWIQLKIYNRISYFPLTKTPL